MIAQLGTSVLLLIAVFGSGVGFSRWTIGSLRLPLATRLAMIPALGLAFLGLFTLVAGHLGILGSWLPYGVAATGLLLGFFGWARFRQDVTMGARAVGRQIRAYPVPLIATAAALVVGAVATVLPPWRTDEVEYHWPAPLEWAALGAWSDSSFRHVDAFPFMEIIYTAAATQESYVAAHVLHYVSFIALGFAVAGVAATMGIRGTGVTAAAALAMPVVWGSSYLAYNDTPVGLFSTLGVAIVMAAPSGSLRGAWIAGGLLAIATSIKPTGIAAAGLLALMILIRYLYDRRGAVRSGVPSNTRFSTIVVQWIAIVSPAIIAVGFWSVRQYVYTGNLVDPSMTTEPDAYALTMLPTALEQAFAPLLPFVSGVVGGFEPWGGRTAVAIQVLLIPAIVYAVWRKGPVLRRFLTMIIPAWAHWIVLGFAIVRTRFHVVSWVLMIVSIRLVLEDAAERYPRARRWLEITWTALILLGLADCSIDMFRDLQRLL